MTETATSTEDHVRSFIDRADRFTAALAAAGDAWDDPSPCEGWTVRDVVAHVIDTQRDFLDRQELPAGGQPDLADPVAAWRSHRAHVEEVLASPDIAGLEYDGFFGRTTIGATMADFYGWDLVIHGWDVARGTGQPWTISDAEAESLHATADGWGDALYSEGICRAPVQVPDDASATDRLVARLGRDPYWQPGS
ncbi:TIGR03086 family protein [Nocardioides seonyuensis]|uniref:TIGR03086 family protein n=1 Tax=Nocardioides seonyuensis TaxID=2518371 RepID=A0A4P7IH21_9ACTN|nr:TIGR03086 family metal-binding protein [Nocardioides seonyuensis]QBX56575.1 TIGR03086 family protein [Nocardioides seonyuensis]